MFTDTVLHATCAMLAGVFVVDESTCTSVAHSDATGTISWFKVLFAPVLCLSLLALLFLEDFFGTTKARNAKDKDDGVPGATEEEERFWSKQRTRQAKHAPLQSPRNKGKKGSALDSQTTIIRVTLVDEDARQSRYKITPLTTMREVLQFYCQRHDAPPDAVVLRHKGKKLSSGETAESLGLQSHPFLDIETNYRRLYEAFKLQSEDESKQLKKGLEEEKLTNRELSVSVVRLEAQAKRERNRIAALEKKMAADQTERDKLAALCKKLQMDVTTHRTARKTAEQTLHKLNEEVQLEKTKKEKKKLERAVARAKADAQAQEERVAELETRMTGLKAQLKAETAKKIAALEATHHQQHEALKEVNAQLSGELERMQTKLRGIEEASQSASAEGTRAKELHLTFMMKAESLERKNQELELEIKGWRAKAQASIIHEDNSKRLMHEMTQWKMKASACETELQTCLHTSESLQQRLAAAEKELYRWKRMGSAGPSPVRDRLPNIHTEFMASPGSAPQSPTVNSPQQSYSASGSQPGLMPPFDYGRRRSQPAVSLASQLGYPTSPGAYWSPQNSPGDSHSPGQQFARPNKPPLHKSNNPAVVAAATAAAKAAAMAAANKPRDGTSPGHSPSPLSNRGASSAHTSPTYERKKVPLKMRKSKGKSKSVGKGTDGRPPRVSPGRISTSTARSLDMLRVGQQGALGDIVPGVPSTEEGAQPFPSAVGGLTGNLTVEQTISQRMSGFQPLVIIDDADPNAG